MKMLLVINAKCPLALIDQAKIFLAEKFPNKFQWTPLADEKFESTHPSANTLLNNTFEISFSLERCLSAFCHFLESENLPFSKYRYTNTCVE